MLREVDVHAGNGINAMFCVEVAEVVKGVFVILF
jgi:hypothetical protein